MFYTCCLLLASHFNVIDFFVVSSLDSFASFVHSETFLFYVFSPIAFCTYSYAQWAINITKRWQWCWWHRYVGDFMMVTDFRCWWLNHYVGDFFRYVGDFSNVSNRSPTSQTCLQHIWSPISVTNIDVTCNSFSPNMMFLAISESEMFFLTLNDL